MFLVKKIKLTTYASLIAAVLLTLVSGGTALNAQVPADTVNSSVASGPGAYPKPSGPGAWTGFYIGAYGGGSFGRSDAATSTAATTSGNYFAATSIAAVNAAGTQTVKPSGFTGGGTFGYNHQSGRFVIGAETDLGTMNASETATTTGPYPCCSPSTFTINQTMKTRWLFTARARAGVAAGNAFIYGTGGVAVTDLNYQAVFSDNYRAATESGGANMKKSGWTAGFGAEFKLGNHWSAKGEYLYADFGAVTNTSTNLNANQITTRPAELLSPAVVYTNPFTHTADLKVNNVRFGINFHF